MSDLDTLSPAELAELQGAVAGAGSPTLPSGAAALTPDEEAELRSQVMAGAPTPTSDLHGLKLFGQAIPKGAAHVANIGTRLLKEFATTPSPETMGAVTTADPEKAMQVQAILAQANRTGTANVNAIDKSIESAGEQPVPGTADKYVSAAGQGIGGALIPLPGGAATQGVKGIVGAMLKNAGIGATAGLASEGANELAKGITGDANNPKTRLASGILSALGVAGGLSLVGKQAGTANQLAAELLDGMSESELAAAAKAYDDHGIQGLQPILSQITNSPKLSAMAEILNERGPMTRGALEAQPGQVKRGMDARLGAVDSAGTRTTEQTASNTLQDLFTERKSAATKARTDAYKSEVAIIGNRAVSMRQISGIANTLRDEAAAMGSSPAGHKLIQIADTLESDAVNFARAPQKSATLNDLVVNLKGYADEIAAKNAQTGIKAGGADKAAGIIQSEITKLKQMAPAYMRADTRYARDTARINEVFNKSAAGRLIGKGARDDSEAANKLYRIFDAGTDPKANVSEIRQIGRMASKTPQGKQDFQNAYVGYLSKRIADATGDAPSAGDVDNAIAAILGKTEGGGASTKVQGLKDALTTIAENKGLPAPQMLSRGFINFLETSRSMVQKQPARGHGMALGDVVERAGASPAGTALRFQYLGNLAKRLERMYSKGAFEEMDKLFSSKEGLDTLRQMAANAPGSPKSQQLMRAYLSTAAVDDNQE